MKKIISGFALALAITVPSVANACSGDIYACWSDWLQIATEMSENCEDGGEGMNVIWIECDEPR